jgi:hypothetical protein
MVLYKGNLITLEYDPATDILSLDWPDVQDLYVPELEIEVKELIKAINHYDIKKLLIDTSKAILNVQGEVYQTFLTEFARELMTTRLLKIARIGTTDLLREKLVKESRESLPSSLALTFKIFNTKAEAMDWLQE